MWVKQQNDVQYGLNEVFYFIGKPKNKNGMKTMFHFLNSGFGWETVLLLKINIMRLFSNYNCTTFKGEKIRNRPL